VMSWWGRSPTTITANGGMNLVIEASSNVRVAALMLLSLAGCGFEQEVARRSATKDRTMASKHQGEAANPEAVLVAAHRSGTTQESITLSVPGIYGKLISDNIEPDLRAELVKCVNNELSRELRSQPETIIRDLNEALLRSGLSEQEVPRLLGAFLQLSPFPLKEMEDYWDILHRLYPEDIEISRLVDIQTPYKDNSPPGGVNAWFYSSAGGMCEYMNKLAEERQDRRDATWTPESLHELPVVLEIGADDFTIEQGRTDVGDKLKIIGVMTAVSSNTGRVLWKKPLEVHFEALPEGAGHRSNHLIDLQGPDVLTGEPFKVSLEYTVVHLSKDGDELSAAVALQQRSSFEPVFSDDRDAIKGAPLGYEVNTLGLDDHPLTHPTTPYGLAEAYRLLSTSRRDEIRQKAQEEREEERRRESFISSPLERISLAYSPTGEADVVRLNTDEPVILIVGATWCGPCQALAPAVKELADLFETQGRDGAKVHRFSMDDDPGSYAKELEKYPGGVLAPEQWAATGLPGVPAYIVVEGGTVSEAGILSAEKIAELKERYVGSADASQP